jgi:hypothetical protein
MSAVEALKAARAAGSVLNRERRRLRRGSHLVKFVLRRLDAGETKEKGHERS